MISKKTRGLWLFIPLIFCVGFRTYMAHSRWKGISPTSTAKSKIFVVYEEASRELKNNLDASDPYSSIASLTVTQAMNSILADYNNVHGSYVRLMPSTDSDFAIESLDRIIKIQHAQTPGATDGYATYKSEGEVIKECDIVLSDMTYENAKHYISTVTHEMGHCMGLDHPQDTIYAIMSYYTSKDVYRLQTDDKMGLIYIYPVDASKAREENTLGLSCAKR
jgi:hypothetical protein